MSWNIFGDYAAKILSPEFNKDIGQYDVVLLQETHLWPEEESSTPVPPEYYMIAVSRPRRASWQRRGGGVMALVRKGIKAEVVVHLTAGDIMVLDMGNCYIVGAYILPTTSRWEGWTEVSPEIRLREVLAVCTASSKPVIVMGDLNAQTASLSGSPPHPPRNSWDSMTNTRGRQVLSWVQDFALCILNGTATEAHTPGRFTSFQPNGRAVVDYAIVSLRALALVLELKVLELPEDPDCAWADHTPLVLTVNRTLAIIEPTRTGCREKIQIEWPAAESGIDILWEATMKSKETLEQGLERLYGKTYYWTQEVQVYTDGSCLNNGKHNAAAGSGTFWGLHSHKNQALRVPGPGPQTNNRGEIFAVILALLEADPRKSLRVTTDSELVIREACYWAPLHDNMGWDRPNGDLLQDMVKLLAARQAPTRFVWIKGHSGNEWGDAADRLAKEGARLPEVGNYRRLVNTPWAATGAPPHEGTMDARKVSTALPETPVARPAEPAIEVRDDPDRRDGLSHRGREKTRKLQQSMRNALIACNSPGEFWRLIRKWMDARPAETEVSLDVLTNELRARMNAPLEMPASFNREQLALNKVLAAALPTYGVDTTPDGLFSRAFGEEEIAWGKNHVRTHTIDSATGADGYTYRDIMAIPNAKIAELLNACLNEMEIPSRWLASLVIGIPKPEKDRKAAVNYRLIVLECCLLKFFTLLIDRRVRDYAERHAIIPETQNGFREGYRTNNNPFILRTMTEKAKAEGTPLYIAYIDLKNAFPWTDRETLWVKLNTWGISGPIVNWLRKLYGSMTYMVRLDGDLSDRFQCNLGLLTGDPGSPGNWNIFLSDFAVSHFPGDMLLHDVYVSKLEQADDIMIATPCPVAFQGKLMDMDAWAADNGCQTQLEKCVFSIAGPKPKQPYAFYLGSHRLKEVRDFKYVGVHFRTSSDDMFVEHYRVNTEKARRMANMCLGVDRFVGDMPVWESRTLYVARVDPYLTSAAEVILDTTAPHWEGLEKVQCYYLRRMLHIHARSVKAVLFSETGLLPIRYRRVVLALGFLKHVVCLPEDRLVWRAMAESFKLARMGHGSWVTDLKLVLANLPDPILWVLPEGGMDADMVESLIEEVKASADRWVDGVVLSSARTRDLLAGRMEMVDGRLVKKVIAFRHYLRVKIPRHRRALTHVVLCCHALAVERLRWSERRRPAVARELRVCRLCRDGVEDAVHALLVCGHPSVQQYRQVFYAQVDAALPGFRSRFTDAEAMMRDLLGQRVTVALLAKFCYDVLEVFYAEPMLIPAGIMLTPDT
ncbi:hypothetical protein D9615_003499 [Tricholomella constricta]|uniref:RNase H type-1 domain-containing protein n=1 Tax=Tricholomella constricta TaxID=117010 RepID=A0A8H5HHS2_9AGAR|nr:hypothetical protein D9615_003499 [Tricholomella constricta]